ncbi:expressed unknown protein [Seminavis robusta]|uniref:Uncharacterized protein n=1 Tax=Seminavis robusta TaxID=568900 RepID=A0A9N8H2F4_9STRA|nr:expressed unknown protein [Seminavis robusta]|eukprot:Sro18_g012890.1 n/a (166) ;mRNA; r:88839-89336
MRGEETDPAVSAEQGIVSLFLAIASGIMAIITATETHLAVAPIQLHACVALHALAFKNPDIETTIADGGGIKAIITAMEMHLGSADIQERACFALDTLASRGPNIQISIADGGGIKAIVAAMEKKSIQRVQMSRKFPLMHCTTCQSRILTYKLPLPTLVLFGRLA